MQHLPKINLTHMIEVKFPGGVRVDAMVDGFTVSSDQPVKAGGTGSAPAPFALFLASLATCAGYYVKAFCDQRELPTEGMSLTMDMEYDPVNRIMGRFIIRIRVPQEFPEKYDNGVINAAAVCAVKKHLKESIAFDVAVERV